MEANTSEQYSITLASTVEDPIILAQSYMMYKIGKCKEPPRGYKPNEENPVLWVKYIASGLLRGSWNMTSRVQMLWKLGSTLPKDVQGQPLDPGLRHA